MSSMYLIDCKFYIPLLLYHAGTLAASAATSGAGNRVKFYSYMKIGLCFVVQHKEDDELQHNLNFHQYLQSILYQWRFLFKI